ncbi:MAG: glutamine synthetase [bacterium]|nr:glutamine synthetase [bacterium]
MDYVVIKHIEYYILPPIGNQILGRWHWRYPIIQQKGYHESHPFSKWGAVRREAMQVISEMGGAIKYGHAEVGNIIYDDIEMVQHEIELLPTAVEDAADQLVLAKWAVREVAYKYGLEVSFAPKIIVGHAGSGMHVHARLVKGGKNMMVDDSGLSDTAKKLIVGFLQLSPSLTAFGNTVPTSFLRLVPHQEAPTCICWGDRNRSVLVRVPLGWLGVENMLKDANPKEPDNTSQHMNTQTVELRSPDGSANVHQLLAGMTVAALQGLEMADSLKIAEELYVSEDAGKCKHLEQLPASCFEAAESLLANREFYERYGIFPPGMIDKLANDLKAHNDKNLSEKLFGNADALKALVEKFIHCG